MSVKTDNTMSTQEILKKAGGSAFRGGLPGAAAMVIQVCTLMPMRTTLNYQYRFGGTSTFGTIKSLYGQGGIFRFYKGLAPALVMGPASRFGDVAANAGVLALLDSYDNTKDLPVFVKTACASGAAALWRINLTPVDTIKTMMQVEGAKGIPALVNKVRTRGPSVMYHGALAASSATFVGHLPWFYTHNHLSLLIPVPDKQYYGQKLLRNAFIGFCASLVSDTCSNSIRVVKTTKQTSTVPITYPGAVRSIIKADGLYGLFFRGLRTKILANGMQGMLFSVLWKFLEEKFKGE
eukprot:Awhi_evm1s5394